MSPTSVPNRFSAPMTCLRSRSGKACTDRKPAATARGANCGHRSAGLAQVAR